MLLINAVNAEGRPVELYVKDGKIAAVGQDLACLLYTSMNIINIVGNAVCIFGLKMGVDGVAWPSVCLLYTSRCV